MGLSASAGAQGAALLEGRRAEETGVFYYGLPDGWAVCGVGFGFGFGAETHF